MTLPAAAPSADLAVDGIFLLGLSFFLGFAFEDVFEHAGMRRPGGVRTFPMLALIGALLYVLDPLRLVPFTGGLLIVGACLVVYYRGHVEERDETGQRNVGLMTLLLNVYAYLLGAMCIALPHWAAVGTTVAAILLLTGRSRLHDLARRIDVREFVIAAQFLFLAGLVLPLLPSEPVTTLTSVTPRQAWLALVVVCGFSYASYLIQRYAKTAARGLWMAALGGLYSSTATTVVLARAMRRDPASEHRGQAGITLATGIMYLRILGIVAVLNGTLASTLAPYLLALFALAALIAFVQYRRHAKDTPPANATAVDRNPLELGPAVVFAVTFVIIAVISGLVETHFGTAGIFTLAAVVGVSDVDPFVLNLAQGAAALPENALAAAVLIAASSNDLLKAAYTLAFAGRRLAATSAAALVALALAGLAAAALAAR